MLVLSRRLNEKFRFPTFQTTVQVLSLSSDVVRLGIDAPAEVTVLRDEIPDRVAEWGPPEEATPDARLQQLGKLMRQRLQVTRLGLSELRRQLPADLGDAVLTLDKLEEDLLLLQRRLETEAGRPTPAVTAADPGGLVPV